MQGLQLGISQRMLDPPLVFRADALEESNTDAHSITDEDVEVSLCSGNTASSSTDYSVHTDVVVADQQR